MATFTDFDEKSRSFTRVITKKPVGVLIQTTTHFIRGCIHIRPEDRLKDELNHGEAFLALTNAFVYDNQGNQLFESDFITINCSQIVWLIPEDEMKSTKQ